jgi:hypothetical protein
MIAEGDCAQLHAQGLSPVVELPVVVSGVWGGDSWLEALTSAGRMIAGASVSVPECAVHHAQA